MLFVFFGYTLCLIVTTEIGHRSSSKAYTLKRSSTHANRQGQPNGHLQGQSQGQSQGQRRGSSHHTAHGQSQGPSNRLLPRGVTASIPKSTSSSSLSFTTTTTALLPMLGGDDDDDEDSDDDDNDPVKSHAPQSNSQSNSQSNILGPDHPRASAVQQLELTRDTVVATFTSQSEVGE